MMCLTDIRICTFILLKMLTVNAELRTTSPKELIYSVGSAVTFKCQTTNPTQTIRWKFSAPSSEFPDTIHTGSQLLGQFSHKFLADFDNRTRESILILKRAELSDTGTFACLEATSAKYKIEFALTVVTSSTVGNGAPAVESATLSTEHFNIEPRLKRTRSPSTSLTNDNYPISTGDSFKAITIGGIVGVLLVCGLIVIILVFVVMKLRQTAAVANSVNETVRSGMLQTSRGHHHKHRRPSGAAEPQPENVSESMTSPTGSSSSIDGHYSEIVEPETPVAATVEIVADNLPIDSSSSVSAGQYQGLDPTAVVQLSTRPPNVYVNLAHQHTLTAQRQNDNV